RWLYMKQATPPPPRASGDVQREDGVCDIIAQLDDLPPTADGLEALPPAEMAMQPALQQDVSSGNFPEAVSSSTYPTAP
ncbi:MAG: hypothetical protein LBB48_02970, partial [Treponema sp.]|nr:hypothetical protein [Treponema sp.]